MCISVALVTVIQFYYCIRKIADGNSDDLDCCLNPYPRRVCSWTFLNSMECSYALSRKMLVFNPRLKPKFRSQEIFIPFKSFGEISEWSEWHIFVSSLSKKNGSSFCLTNMNMHMKHASLCGFMQNLSSIYALRIIPSIDENVLIRMNNWTW